MNSENNNCEVVITTIVVLAKLYLTCGQYETAGVHVNALRRIVALRGDYAENIKMVMLPRETCTDT
jgi:hypothetical protein